MTILLTVVATVALTIVVLNFVTGEKKIDKRLKSLYAVSDPQFLRSMGSLLGPALRDGNRVTGLSNGDEIFPQMLAAIRSAQRTITFETYIYWSGSIGREFAEALSERARGSVKVHVLLDWVGSASMEGDILETMEASGVEVKKYHPLRWYNLARMNNRTHRKLLVVDGAIGFTGAVRWDRRPMARSRPGRRALERLALPPRGTCRGSVASRLHGQLDEGERRGASRRGVLP